MSTAQKAARQIIAGLLADENKKTSTVFGQSLGRVNLRAATARRVVATPAPDRCIECGAHCGKYRRCYDCAQEEQN